MLELDFNDVTECLDVSVRSDGVDGSGSYKFICRLEHTGHQSCAQSFGVYFSTEVSIVEVPGDVEASAKGNHVQFRRNNQMNDNGLVDIWIKLSADRQPEVTGITDITCIPDENSPFVAGTASAACVQDETEPEVTCDTGSACPPDENETEPEVTCDTGSACLPDENETEPEVTCDTGSACLPDENGSEVPAMGPVQEAIRARRSVRSYKPDMLPKAVIKQIVDAGTYAASGMNRQSPVVIAITDQGIRNKLSAMNAQILGNPGTDPFYGAPVVLVVLADKNIPTYLYDGSLVMGNMMLAAEELGIGSCWIHRAKEEFGKEEGKEILRTLGIEGNYEGIGHLILGYPEGEKQPAASRKEDYIYFLE